MIKELNGQRIVYASTYYYLELNCARMLKTLNMSCNTDALPTEHVIRRLNEEGIELDDMQRMAVMEALFEMGSW